MARALENIELQIYADPADGFPQVAVFTYDVVNGNARKSGGYEVPQPVDWTKKIHNTGAVGEMWRDAVDAIKSNEEVT